MKKIDKTKEPSPCLGTDGSMFNGIFNRAKIISDKTFYKYATPGSSRTADGFVQYSIDQDGIISNTILGHYSNGLSGLKKIAEWLLGGE